MAGGRGRCVVAWLERWGEGCLRQTQPYVYQQFLLHIGATDTLCRYDGTRAYWHSVQVILDSFFTSAERAAMCGELIREPLFADRDDFRPFLLQARSELAVHDLIASVEARIKVEAPRCLVKRPLFQNIAGGH